MAYKALKVTITNAATKIVEGTGSTSFTLKVPADGETVYVGGADVDVTNGYPVEPGEGISDEDLAGQDDLYGIVATGPQDANLLRRD